MTEISPRVVVVGASGMAGHIIYLYLKEMGWDAHGFGGRPSFLKEVVSLDLTKPQGVQELLSGIRRLNPDLIVNAAGLLNKGNEKRIGDTILLDSFLPHCLAEAFQHSKSRVFHISTDCVFSGKRGGYKENDFKDGDTVYDRAKSLGEIVNGKDLTFRQSIIGPELRSQGTGLLQWVLGQQGMIRGFSNAIWNGVSTLELAKGIDRYFQKGTTGLIHFVTHPPLSKYNMLRHFIEEFQLGYLELEIGEMAEPLDKSLVSTRIDVDILPQPFTEQLRELHAWMRRHADLYPHYAFLHQ